MQLLRIIWQVDQPNNSALGTMLTFLTTGSLNSRNEDSRSLKCFGRQVTAEGEKKRKGKKTHHTHTVPAPKKKKKRAARLWSFLSPYVNTEKKTNSGKRNPTNLAHDTILQQVF